MTMLAVTENGAAVTENQLPVTELQLPQNGHFWAKTAHPAKSVQCIGIYVLIDVCRVTEVTDFIQDREVRDDPLQKYILNSFFRHSPKLLSIAEKVSYFSYRIDSLTLEGAN